MKQFWDTDEVGTLIISYYRTHFLHDAIHDSELRRNKKFTIEV